MDMEEEKKGIQKARGHQFIKQHRRHADSCTPSLSPHFSHDKGHQTSGGNSRLDQLA